MPSPWEVVNPAIKAEARLTSSQAVQGVRGEVGRRGRRSMSEHQFEGELAPDRQRSTKFTPQNIRQIVNLVDRGKGREEIAEIIGVTPGTLAVTVFKTRHELAPSISECRGPEAG
jgi:hypothetical protein